LDHFPLLTPRGAALEQVEVFIDHQVMVLNTEFDAMADEKAAEDQKEFVEYEPFFSTRRKDGLLIAAYALIANEITHTRRWPWALPDPQTLSIIAHKKVEKQLLHVHFRDDGINQDDDGNTTGICKRLKINYGPYPISPKTDKPAPADMEAGAA
jgi:hypothetical protein